MGGGASKRKAALQEELQARATTVTDETVSMVAKDQERRQRKRAATIIQSAWRGFVGRRRVQARRDELAAAQHALESRSATTIQARVRGRRARQEMVQRKKAARRIQSRARGRSARALYAQQRQAATSIQAAFRGRRGRREAWGAREVHSAVVLQSLLRRRFVSPLRTVKAALLVQRRYRYLRACGNWAEAITVRHKERALGAMQAGARAFLVRLRRRGVAAETAKLTQRLLDGAGLSRLWPKWGTRYTRPGSVVGAGNTPHERWLKHNGMGGWNLSYDALLELREGQLGGMGLPGMPRVEWGLNSADRARLLEETKRQRPRWAKEKVRFREIEAERVRQAARDREAQAATRIQAVHRGRVGRRMAEAKKEEARRARVPGWGKLRKLERQVMTTHLAEHMAAEALLRAAARRGDRRVRPFLCPGAPLSLSVSLLCVCVCVCVCVARARARWAMTEVVVWLRLGST
jgi:hypothetical protein